MACHDLVHVPGCDKASLVLEPGLLVGSETSDVCVSHTNDHLMGKVNAEFIFALVNDLLAGCKVAKALGGAFQVLFKSRQVES